MLIFGIFANGGSNEATKASTTNFYNITFAILVGSYIIATYFDEDDTKKIKKKKK